MCGTFARSTAHPQARIGSSSSHNRSSRLLSLEGASRYGRRCARSSLKRAQASRHPVSYYPQFLFTLLFLNKSPRSREWVCSRCNRSNLECLPDPPPPNDASTSDSVSEVQTAPVAEALPTPVEVMPPQPPPLAETNVSVSVREATSTGVDGAPRSESEDSTLVVASPPASTSIPSQSQNLSGARVGGARQASGPTAFHPSQTHTTVRPPMLLDTAICVLLVLVFALLCRRIF